MKTFSWVYLPTDPKCKSCFLGVFIMLSLIFGSCFIKSSWDGKGYQQKLSTWQILEALQGSKPDICKNRCRPRGSEFLPEKIVTETSNLEMQPLWGSSIDENKRNHNANLLAIAVGFRQRETVDRIIRKFRLNDFAVMLFHYDGIVDKWRDYSWNDAVIHISAGNQTKWWFAKRFLHPDIVAAYNYVFLWDEDVGVENFNPKRYLSIVGKGGLEISQPALDAAKSVIHHPITARKRKSVLHRRMYKFKGGNRCYENSTAPPCVGWVEMMVPVFSRMAWRCTWYMLQNDLIHAWGMDKQLGYCAQGDRTKKVGVVDAEYVVHLGLSTLGVFNHSKEANAQVNDDSRLQVRQQSSDEMQVFLKRWKVAARDDLCWVDHFLQADDRTSH